MAGMTTGFVVGILLVVLTLFAFNLAARYSLPAANAYRDALCNYIDT